MDMVIFSATTFNIKGLFVTFSIKILRIECIYAQCRDLFMVMLSVFMRHVVAPHIILLFPYRFQVLKVL